MTEPSSDRRIIQVGRNINTHREPRPRSVRPTKITDYPAVPAAYLEVARRLSNPLLMGPPICDELIAFVRHLLTEEEADLVRHLGIYRSRTARDLARAVHRPAAEVEPILRRLALEKRCITSLGPDLAKRYKLMPIFPGIYEMVLIGCSMDTLSDWHRRFAESFEALYETGYSTDYLGDSTRMVRFVPVGKAIEAHPMALPFDRMEVILDRFDSFAVGQCQCRMSMAVLGQGCGKPLGNCTMMGEIAESGIRDGWARRVSKKEVFEIKAEAEAHGLVSWILNVESTKGQASCSCCGCCCHAMRIVSEFNTPSMFAPPHFVPRFDPAKCAYCGKCAQECPMAALVVDPRAKSHTRKAERCIGCGLCVVACDKRRAVVMEPVPECELPYRSWFAMQLRTTPRTLRTAWKVWRQRR